MTISELVSAIALKHKDYGITMNESASPYEIINFENKIGFELPSDFKELYSVCNGFHCTDDIFNMTPLEDITRRESDYGKDWFHFSEYMIYSDTWSLRRKSDGSCEIVNKGEKEVVLTTSLIEFLERFLKGGVFDKWGLYEWHEELK